jgi:lysophospholipase L1-like esterase
MLGDSLTSPAYVYWQGFRDYVDGLFVAAAAAPLNWINSGISGAGIIRGDPCLSTAPQREALVIRYNPHWLVIFVGVNDVNFATPWSASTYQSTLLFMAQDFLARCPALAAARICICPPWFNGEPTGAKDTQMDQARDACAAVAAATGCQFLDWRTIRPTDGGYTTDTIHPTQKGKDWLSARLIASFGIAP